MKVMFRRILNADVTKVVNLIRRNFLEVNIKDYSEEAMEIIANEYDEAKVSHIAQEAHMYVAVDKDEEIIGCGAIASILGSEDESYLLTIFVIPECHGMGIGRKIIDVLEHDVYYLRAKRVELSSSITACDFYLKLGYVYKNGVKELEKEDIYRMEKRRMI